MALLMEDQQSTVIGRLEREREQAERRYVAALAALDAASGLQPTVTRSLAGLEADVARVGQIWGDAAVAGGWFARLKAEFSRLLPWRRRALNGALVAALRRQAEVTRALADATLHFQSHVVWYGQTIATFAKSQRQGAGAQNTEVVHAALNAIASDWQQRWDSLQTRELRYDARTTALTKAYDELREVVGLAQQTSMSLKRTVEALGSPARTEGTAPLERAPADSTAGVDTNAFKYVAFEDRFRGSREDIRKRLQDYLPLFAGAKNVLDVGCGRGELLDLFRENGIEARGIDSNDEMVAACRARGLTADRVDALTFLQSQPDASLGGIIAIQVVEHLEPAYLMRLVETAFHKLAPGGPLVLETINAACWTAFFDSYIRDFTHVRPIHPDTLRYLVQASGFPDAETKFLSPIAEQDKLPFVKVSVPETDDVTAIGVREVVEALNAHAERLNSQLFTYRDFAIVARR
jgi:2-polyprenyl-3-methyl-5-hydroxy-6-metoxy-1,4-benzoquinol methylase